MFPNVYLFNPDYDMAMANFTPLFINLLQRFVRMIADFICSSMVVLLKKEVV